MNYQEAINKIKAIFDANVPGAPDMANPVNPAIIRFPTKGLRFRTIL